MEKRQPKQNMIRKTNVIFQVMVMFAYKSSWWNNLRQVNINWMEVCFIKHSELRNQMSNVENISAKNVNMIISRYCVNRHGKQIGQLHAGCAQDDQLKQYCKGFMLLQHTQALDTQVHDKLYFLLLWNMNIACNTST